MDKLNKPLNNVELKCPKCGEKIQFDSDKKSEMDKVFCSYCGNEMTAIEAVQIAVKETQQMIDEMQAKSLTSNVGSELDNLYTLARRAKDTNNSENALKYYDKILPKDPNNWEPNFYTVYYQAMNCKLGGIVHAASNVKEMIPVVSHIMAIENNPNTGEVKSEFEYTVAEVTQKLTELTSMFHSASHSHFIECIRSGVEYAPEYVEVCVQCSLIMYAWATSLESYWSDRFGKYIASSYATGVEFHKNMARKLRYENDFNKQKQEIFKITKKIQKYNPNYKVGAFKKDNNNDEGGCYIATAVYGSYDCPEVWTLRRFRDYTLYKSWYGKAFIKAYYATSPTLVKWFGQSQWFKKSWSAVLNRFVVKLNKEGVANTPYNERKF